MEYWSEAELKFLDENKDLIESEGGVITREIEARMEPPVFIIPFALKFLWGLYKEKGFSIVFGRENTYEAYLRLKPNKKYSKLGWTDPSYFIGVTQAENQHFKLTEDELINKLKNEMIKTLLELDDDPTYWTPVEVEILKKVVYNNIGRVEGDL